MVPCLVIIHIKQATALHPSWGGFNGIWRWDCKFHIFKPSIPKWEINLGGTWKFRLTTACEHLTIIENGKCMDGIHVQHKVGYFLVARLGCFAKWPHQREKHIYLSAGNNNASLDIAFLYFCSERRIGWPYHGYFIGVGLMEWHTYFATDNINGGPNWIFLLCWHKDHQYLPCPA